MSYRPHTLVFAAWIWLLLFPLFATAAATEPPKIALVIGNANYASITSLANPVNDATDMAARLKALGFKVRVLKDATQRTMEQGIREFVRDLYQPDAVGLFFFAGHGLELGGRNYLIPVDAEIKMEADVKYETVDAGRVLDGMKGAGNNLNLVMLDACRNNPYRGFFRSGNQGLAPMHPAAGSLVLYATEPGKQAQDGTGRNGVFTKRLLEAMSAEGLKVEDVFKKTAAAVRQDTGGDQTPWWEGVIIGNFYFINAPVTVQAPAPQMTPSVPAITHAPAPVLQPPPPPPAILGHLQINVNAADAQVFVNDESVGKAAPSQPLNLVNRRPGPVRIKVKAAGFEDSVKQSSIAPGTWTQVVISLPRVKMAKIEPPPAYVPKPPAPAPAPVHKEPGSLSVQVEPADARVRILNIGPKYSPGMRLEPGRYHIEASRDGFRMERRWIDHGKEDQRIIVRLEKSRRPLKQAGPVEPKRPQPQSIPLRPGRYEVLESSGFDEPVLSGSITVSKAKGNKRGWLLFEMLGTSGYYQYGCEIRWDGRRLYGRVVDTNDGESHGHEFTATLRRRGELVVWSDDDNRRMLLRPGAAVENTLPFH